jgi:hypothetical protein
MNGASSIRGAARTWRTRVRPALAAGGAPNRDDAPRPQAERVAVKPRRESPRRRDADPTTAFFVQLLDQPAPRGLKADHGLRRAWADAYRDACGRDGPRLLRTADERV